MKVVKKAVKGSSIKKGLLDQVSKKMYTTIWGSGHLIKFLFFLPDEAA